MVDRAAAYGPKGVGTGATITTAFIAQNPWLTVGVAVVVGLLDGISTWYDRWQTKKKDENAD